MNLKIQIKFIYEFDLSIYKHIYYFKIISGSRSGPGAYTNRHKSVCFLCTNLKLTFIINTHISNTLNINQNTLNINQSLIFITALGHTSATHDITVSPQIRWRREAGTDTVPLLLYEGWMVTGTDTGIVPILCLCNDCGMCAIAIIAIPIIQHNIPASAPLRLSHAILCLGLAFFVCAYSNANLWCSAPCSITPLCALGTRSSSAIKSEPWQHSHLQNRSTAETRAN